MLPKVSVIVSCYNYEQYVAKAIHSVVAQTYQNIQCVVIDDCSTDHSYRVICSTLEEANRTNFRVIRLGRNSGQMLAFRAGLENTDGQFVVFLDADDLLENSFIEKHVALHLNSTRSAAMTASDTLTVDGADHVLEGTFFTFGFPEQVRTPLLDIHPSSIPSFDDGNIRFSDKGRNLKAKYRVPLRSGWPFSGTSSFMFRRDVLRMIVSPETDSIKICADWYLVQLASAMGGAILIYEPLGRYRIHSKNHFVGGAITGGNRKPRMQSASQLLDSINRKAEEFVSRNRDQLSMILEDSFFDFFSHVRGFRRSGPSPFKRALEWLWEKFPRRFQKSIMPLADFVDRWVK